MVRFTPFLLMFAVSSATAADRQEIVPMRFQGEWNSDLHQCGTGLNDSRLVIGANRIRFHESGGPIRALVIQGEFDLALISELSGEGDVWLSYHHFRLSADHTNLSEVTDEGTGIVRYHCPNTR